MIRVVAGCALVLGAGVAHAERIVEPKLVRECSIGKSWAAVATCLGKLGPTRILHTTKSARVVALEKHGLALFVERKGTWNLEGLAELGGTDHDLLGVTPLTIGTRSGYRVDIGRVFQHRLELQDAQWRIQSSLYCSGNTWICTEVITACDILVRGTTRWTFRGTVTLDKRVAVIAGDRSHAGTHCSVPERITLRWYD